MSEKEALTSTLSGLSTFRLDPDSTVTLRLTGRGPDVSVRSTSWVPLPGDDSGDSPGPGQRGFRVDESLRRLGYCRGVVEKSFEEGRHPKTPVFNQRHYVLFQETETSESIRGGSLESWVESGSFLQRQSNEST